jgi:acetyl esterase/lipase
MQADDPRVSPLFDDLKGLPPTLVQVGSKEILLDDSKRFREKGKRQESKYT